MFWSCYEINHDFFIYVISNHEFTIHIFLTITRDFSQILNDQKPENKNHTHHLFITFFFFFSRSLTQNKLFIAYYYSQLIKIKKKIK